MTDSCPQCGAPLPENCLFCPSCGAACAPSPDPAQPPLPEEAAPAEETGSPEAAPAQEAAPVQDAAPAPEAAPVQDAAPAPETAPAQGGAVPPPPPASGPRYAAQAPRPVSAAPLPAPDKNEMTTGRYLACLILFAIPVVGLVMMFIWGFGHDENVHRRRLARAALLFTALALVLAILLSIVLAAVGALGHWLFPRYGYAQGPRDSFGNFWDDYEEYYDYYYEDPYDYYGGGNGYGGHHLATPVQ